MTLNWFDRLSDWNPQVFRELKGRLKQRYVIFAMIGSLTTQLLVLMYFWSLLPINQAARSIQNGYPQYNTYCTGTGSYRSFQCLYDVLGHPLVNWQNWWSDMFHAFSWMLPGLLLVAGVYLLVGDLGKEERRGTLNFIRLSPQTSQKILLGKLLGVPAIPYLAVALAIPIHLLAAKGADVAIADLLSVYFLTAAACAFSYSAALLYALMGGFQNWVGAVAVAMLYSSFYLLWSDTSRWQLQWFHLNVSVLFAILTLSGGTYWIWKAMNRRFRNPGATLLSKSQSYRMTLCFEVWLLGFAIRDMSEYSRPFDDLIILGFFNLLWFVVLVAAMTPHRQMLLDWARYRRERVVSAKKFWARSIVNDLLWGEKSPAVVAIAVNLLLAFAVVTPWILSWDNNHRMLQGFASILFGATLTLICATIAQLLMLMKSQKRTIWATSAIAAVIILPPTVLSLLQLYPGKAPLAWLFSIGAFAVFQTSVSTAMVFAAFLGHLAILSALSFRLTRQLRRAGESETKALLLGRVIN